MSPTTIFRRAVITTADVYASKIIDGIEEEVLIECMCGYSREERDEYLSVLPEEVGSIVEKQGYCLILEVLAHQMKWDILVDLSGWPQPEADLLSQALLESELNVGFGEIGKEGQPDLARLVRCDVHLARLAVNLNLLSQLGEARRPYLIEAMRMFAGIEFSSKTTS